MSKGNIEEAVVRSRKSQIRIQKW